MKRDVKRDASVKRRILVILFCPSGLRGEPGKVRRGMRPDFLGSRYQTHDATERGKALMPSEAGESVRVEYTPEFKRNLRALAKKYRHIWSDIEPEIRKMSA